MGNPKVNVAPGDFEWGNWDPKTRTFGPPPAGKENDPNYVNAVRVKVRMDNTVTGNNKSPTFLSQLIGINGFQVTNTAIGYRGYQGDSFHFNWPVAIDSCSTSHENNGCGNDFCAVTSRPPTKPCPLDLARPQDDSAEVVCLEFSNTADQNACWTNYDPTNTNAATSKNIVADGGYGGPVEV